MLLPTLPLCALCPVSFTLTRALFLRSQRSFTFAPQNIKQQTHTRVASKLGRGNHQPPQSLRGVVARALLYTELRYEGLTVEAYVRYRISWSNR